MDSLLDALTNVVGILVIVLVAVQLSSQEAAQNIIEEFEKTITPDKQAQVQEEAEQVTKELIRMEEKIAREKRMQSGDPTQEIKSLEAELNNLQQLTQREKQTYEKKMKEVQRQKTDVKKKTDGLQKQIVGLEKKNDLAEVQRVALMTELNKARPQKAPPVKEVRLPSPKPSFMMVPNAKGEPERKYLQPIIVLCRGTQVIPFPITGLSVKENPLLTRWFSRTLTSLKLVADAEGWITPNPRIPNKEPLTSNDAIGDAIVKKALESPPVLPGYKDFDFSIIRRGRALQLVLTPKENAGEDISKASSKGGQLNRMLLDIAKSDNPYRYIKYLVEPDAFETYLEVRQFTDAWTMPGNSAFEGWPAGWEPIQPNSYKREYFVGTRTGEKPPPSPNPPRKPGPRVVGNDLD